MEPPGTIGAGTIASRQTTFWDLALNDGRMLRLHFIDKQEFHGFAERFATYCVLESHPLLVEYSDEWVTLGFNGFPANPNRVLTEIEAAVANASHGWRSASRYLNTLIAPTQLLQSGSGIIWAGPNTYAMKVIDILNASGVSVQRFEHRSAPNSCQVALFGQSYVVARNFRVESLG